MRLARVVVVALVIAVVGGPSALALDREDFAVSRQSPSAKRTYDQPIVANNTSLTHRPTECRTATYCDTIDLEVNSNGFVSDDLYYVDILLSWPQQFQETEEGNAQSNDLDLFIYDESETRIGQSATANEMEKTQIDLPYTGTYFLVVNNFAGPNLGYTFDIKLTYGGKQKEIPEFVRPTAPPTVAPGADTTPTTRTPAVRTTPAPETELEPDATLAPVLTPGPDGEPTTLSLEAIQAQGRVDGGGPPWWALVLLIVVGVGAVGGLGFFGYRRFRARGA